MERLSLPFVVLPESLLCSVVRRPLRRGGRSKVSRDVGGSEVNGYAESMVAGVLYRADRAADYSRGAIVPARLEESRVEAVIKTNHRESMLSVGG